MEHWVYGTDDDEPPKKESDCGAFTFQQPAEMERISADSPNQDTRDEGTVTNAQGDPSWCFTPEGVVLPSRPEAGTSLPLRPWGRRISI